MSIHVFLIVEFYSLTLLFRCLLQKHSVYYMKFHFFHFHFSFESELLNSGISYHFNVCSLQDRPLGFSSPSENHISLSLFHLEKLSIAILCRERILIMCNLLIFYVLPAEWLIFFSRDKTELKDILVLFRAFTKGRH